MCSQHVPVDHEEKGHKAKTEADPPYTRKGVGSVVVSECSAWLGSLGARILGVCVGVGRDLGVWQSGVEVVRWVLGDVVSSTSASSSRSWLNLVESADEDDEHSCVGEVAHTLQYHMPKLQVSN